MRKETTLTLSPLAHTWIIDLDGTVVKHNGYKLDGKDTLLPGAKALWESIPEDDVIILLTSRTLAYQAQTEAFLHLQGLRYDHILFDLPYGERILLNDAKPSGLRTALAVDVRRDEGIPFQVYIDESL